MAEREGFEPSVRFPAHMISNHAHSATLSPLLNRKRRSVGKRLGERNTECGLALKNYSSQASPVFIQKGIKSTPTTVVLMATRIAVSVSALK
jgi:hypothetical protein